MQVLNAKVVHLDTFGRARGIKHLMLKSPCLHCSRLSTALTALEQLQTLWLNKGIEPHTPGALQLDALTALRTVALDGLVPESILIEEGCELHITQHSYQRIEDAVWDTVLPHLRSVWVSDSDAVVTALPSCLLKAEKLTRASLRVHRFGTTAAPVPLDGTLAQVDALVVQCKDLHATVPADVTWCDVSLAASSWTCALRTLRPLGERSRCFASATAPYRYAASELCWALLCLEPLPASPKVDACRGMQLQSCRLSSQGGSQHGTGISARVAASVGYASHGTSRPAPYKETCTAATAKPARSALRKTAYCTESASRFGLIGGQ